MHGFTIGADVSPINLLPDQAGSPTGPDLVATLVSDHVRLIRLVAYAGSPTPGLAEELDDTGWRSVFSELDDASIGVVLEIGGEAGPDGQFRWGHWPPEPPTPDFPRAGQAVESTSEWVSGEASILADIKSQCGGLPPSLVGLEVANEPLVNAQTIPMLTAAIDAAREELPGIPVTIGGWRVAARHPGERWDYNNPIDAHLVGPLVDFLSVHIYPDNIALGPHRGADRSSTDPATYVPLVKDFLEQARAAAGGKPIMVGEFGALDGSGTGQFDDPTGGSPAHQSAVIEAVIIAMAGEEPALTGGTVWEFEQNAGLNFPCKTWDLMCLGRPAEPAASLLGREAARDDH